MMMMWALFVVLSLLSFAAGDVIDPASKIVFKDSVKLPGGSECSLAGVGCRVKKLFGPAAVKVYGLGIYLDKAGATSALASYKGADSSSLETNQNLFNDIKKGSYDKTFVLKMARGVGTEKMVSALAESVKPRLSGPTAPLSEFESLLLKALSVDGVKKDTQFGFVCKSGSLCVSVNGKDAGSISSGPLSTAMQDVYLGKTAVVPEAKKSVARGVTKWLG